jgi:hypothetical protein
MTGKSKITISSEDFRVNPGSEFKLDIHSLIRLAERAA